ncbi:MAG: hypothetical protein JSR82_00925 [Verrucomicrobia bacterium]|nr:hypothetical protein [Verrucomicrobiota bacterium]
MLDSLGYLLRWPSFSVALAIHGLVVIAALLVGGGARFPGLTWVRERRWAFALLLACAWTPSLLTDFFVAATPGPALVGLLFTLPSFFLSEQPAAFLAAVTVLYVLPLAVTGAIAFARYPRWQRRSPLASPGS